MNLSPISRTGWLGMLALILALAVPRAQAAAACGFADHADVNAARNIAAGHAVTARGGFRDTGPVNREPQLLASFTGRQ